MQDSEWHLIFVNDTPYRVWSEVSTFRNDDFIRGFDPTYHLNLARLLEPGLVENGDQASLGIRTIHGLASEAFFAFLFALLQAPYAPAAWFRLYNPRDLDKLLGRLEKGEVLPSRLELTGATWHDVATALIPMDESDSPGALSVVRRFGEFWERLASDFRSSPAKEELNSLKHGLRARPASPYLTIGGHHVPSAEHGSSFPVLNRQGSDVLLSMGCRSWSARSLLAQLELISASLVNLLALLKLLHGMAEDLELQIPGEEVFEAAKPPESQILSALTLTTRWPENMRPQVIDKAKALAVYQRLGCLRIQRR